MEAMAFSKDGSDPMTVARMDVSIPYPGRRAAMRQPLWELKDTMDKPTQAAKLSKRC